MISKIVERTQSKLKLSEVCLALECLPSLQSPELSNGGLCHDLISRNLTALCCDRSLILEIINYFIISMIKFIVIVVSCLFTELE